MISLVTRNLLPFDKPKDTHLHTRSLDYFGKLLKILSPSGFAKLHLFLNDFFFFLFHSSTYLSFTHWKSKRNKGEKKKKINFSETKTYCIYVRISAIFFLCTSQSITCDCEIVMQFVIVLSCFVSFFILFHKFLSLQPLLLLFIFCSSFSSSLFMLIDCYH